MATNWAELGISVRRRTGEEKTYCPKCRESRKHKNDKSLSVNHDKGVFHCHHCDWKGGTDDKPRAAPIKRVYRKPEYVPTPTAEDAPASQDAPIYKWFAERGIPAHIVDEAKVEVREHWMPQTQKKERTIAFPYFRYGEVVNVKYRTANKDFALEKDAELILYGMDDAGETESDTLYVVEGEIDCLSCRVADTYNVVSVPSGAKTNLDLIAECDGWLDTFERVVFAGDADSAGQHLADELARRVGVEKSWRVRWPGGCKDANEVLVKHGAEVLGQCLDNAKPVPVDGAFYVEDYKESLDLLYEEGRSPGLTVGWNSLQRYYRVDVGEWTVITGAPSSGKSFFMMNIMVNMALRHGWRFVVYPPENLPPSEYLSSLLEIWSGQPFDKGPTPRMSRETKDAGQKWANNHFVILDPGEDEQTVEGILDRTKTLVRRWGAKGLVIDPWNEVDHDYPSNMTETQYIGRTLKTIGRFTRHHSIHTWVLAHPIKPTKDAKTGQYPVPTLYDIEGSSHWRNKAHMGISLWRDMADETKPTQVHVQKVKRRWRGQLGMAELSYDKVTGRFNDPS